MLDFLGGIWDTVTTVAMWGAGICAAWAVGSEVQHGKLFPSLTPMLHKAEKTLGLGSYFGLAPDQPDRVVDRAPYRPSPSRSFTRHAEFQPPPGLPPMRTADISHDAGSVEVASQVLPGGAASGSQDHGVG